jgi:hypothetical protein
VFISRTLWHIRHYLETDFKREENQSQFTKGQIPVSRVCNSVGSTLVPGFDSASNRNGWQESSWWYMVPRRRLKLTSWAPSLSPFSSSMSKSRRLPVLCASAACYRDTLPLTCNGRLICVLRKHMVSRLFCVNSKMIGFSTWQDGATTHLVMATVRRESQLFQILHQLQ